jgi:hypothetical protein
VAGYVASTDYEGSGRGLLQGDIWLVRIDDWISDRWPPDATHYTAGKKGIKTRRTFCYIHKCRYKRSETLISWIHV